MKDYTELVKALRCKMHFNSCSITDCEYYHEDTFCKMYDLLRDAADAIAALAQIRWERDMAMEQLEENGISFGAKPKHGGWIKKQDDCSWWYECSNCGERPLYTGFCDVSLSAFCPSCGAKMGVQE